MDTELHITSEQITESVSSETARSKKVEKQDKAPLVFDYRDYRKFLSDWYRWKKRVQPNYSGSLFARKAGIGAHTLLGMVAKGKRNLGYSTIASFAKGLDLKSDEAAYFEKLVLLNQASTPAEKSRYYQELRAVSKGRGHEAVRKIDDYNEYLKNWYHVAIRELAGLGDFQNDPAWIASKLKKRITSKQASEAMRLLFSLGLLKEVELPSGERRITVVEPAVDVDIDPLMIDFTIQQFHQQYLDCASHSIENEAREQRDMSSLTIAASPDDIPRIFQRIREFRNLLNQEFTKPVGQGGKVIAINTQVLVLTK
jgi:uncharacterized protein (TIGR02147 family)